MTNVPVLHNVWAYICFLFNLLIPGTGTALAAVLGQSDINKTQLVIAFFQFLTSVYIVGWIWSVYWGYLIVAKSKGDHRELRQLLGAD